MCDRVLTYQLLSQLIQVEKYSFRRAEIESGRLLRKSGPTCVSDLVSHFKQAPYRPIQVVIVIPERPPGYSSQCAVEEGGGSERVVARTI